MNYPFFIFIFLCFANSYHLIASPTSLFWTNCSTDIQSTDVFHISTQNYFSIGNRTGKSSSLPPDIGLTYGLFTWKDISSEIGVDYLVGIRNPWQFNGKLAISEGKLFSNAPSFSVGIFDVGLAHSNNLAVVNAIMGHSLPYDAGRAFFGLFKGKQALGKQRSGWMCGYEKRFVSVKDGAQEEYFKWQFLADYSSGKNVNGGGGFAIAYYFTSKISLETGPTWFNDTKTNGRWKWSVQLGIDI